jgi:ElaB/YqjD/DUF883 family membrane-anchored ribosome-binding protein
MGSATGEVTTQRQNAPSDAPNLDVTGSDGIRAEIESTRADMSETVDAIQSKLSPQNVQETTELVTKQVKDAAVEVSEIAAERLKRAALEVSEQIKGDIHKATVGRVEKVMNNVKVTTRDAGTSLLETIKENPIPAALIGIGLTWLAVSRTTSDRPSQRGQYYSDYSRSGYPQYPSSSGYPQFEQGRNPISAQAQRFAGTVQEKAEHAAENVSNVAEDVKSKAADAVDQAQQRLGEFGGEVQHRAQRVVSKSRSMLEENPLMAGALALAVGAAIGFALPETQRENELMGEARDRLMRQAGDAAQDTLHKVQRVATEAAQATKEAVKQEAENQGLVSERPTSSYSS